MLWALLILFGTAVGLLGWSLFKTKDSKSKVDEKLEHFSVQMMEEMKGLEEQVRHLELDSEITAKRAGVYFESREEHEQLRKLLDLHKRGYSKESMAAKVRMSEEEVNQLLSPYIEAEKGAVTNGS